MNILLTSTGFLEDREHKHLIQTWRDHHHIAETLPFERLMDYLIFDPSSRWGAVDTIVCKADTDPEGIAAYTLQRALNLATDFRGLPESCAMRDGRKWKSIPLILISEQPYYFGYPDEISRLRVTIIRPSPYPLEILAKVRDTVDEYIKRVLEDYRDMGLLVRFEKGRAQIGPGLRKKDPEMESSYYYAPADLRNNRGWVTVMRDNEGLRADVELFQQLLEMNATETQMQRFFEENPFFLMQARLGIQIPHPSYAIRRWSPDFAFTSILGPRDIKDIELLEMKGPAEKLLNYHKNHPGFTSILHSAINQVRDYGRYISYPENHKKIMKQLGYIPTQSRLAVLIGRDYQDEERMEVLERRRSETPDIKIITYDKILETQADQLSRIVIPDLDVSTLRLGSFDASVFPM
jgi:hypothetical protein